MVMQNKRIYLSPPHIGDLEQQMVAEAFHTNWIAPLGPHVEQFEREIAEYVGVKGAVALSSGTAAIHLALKLLNVTRGDIVFCSSLTFAASANPIIYEGAIPVFIDSDYDTWNMSPIALRNAFRDAAKQRKLPKAVIVVNLYGQSANYDDVLEICNEYGVPVIEDAAESLGATFHGRKSGSFGNFGVFSFNGNKIITTSGGGMLVSNDTAALEKARFWATQARDQARHYQHSEIGYNYRMSNVLAGIGRGQLRVLEKRVEARREIFNRYFTALSHFEGVTFMPEISSGRSTRWLTAMIVDQEHTNTTVNDILDLLAADNIEARPVWKPLHQQPVFNGCAYYPHSEPISVSDYLFNNGICLPSGSNMTEEEQGRVIDVIKKALSGKWYSIACNF